MKVLKLLPNQNVSLFLFGGVKHLWIMEAFNFFYEGTSNAEDVATAFSEIGINTIAEAFRRSLNVFTSQSFEFDPTTRYKRSSYSVADVGAVFTELNGIVWGVDEPELLEILYGYIKANRSSFEHIQII